MNTTENNKIIAEFMGCEFTQIGKRTLVSPTPTPIGTTYIDKLLYHSDWNWLMEVVEKIESLSFIFKTHGNASTFVKKGVINERIWNDEFTGKTKKDSVYNACLEFIEWYNQQKQ